MSFRHLDAVYSVRKIDGSVDWKLGGTARPESLTVLNDPVAAAATPSAASTTRGFSVTAP